MLLDQSRQPYQRPLSLLALVRKAGAEPVLAKVTRIRYEGCELRCDLPLTAGEAVDIEIARMGSIRASAIKVQGDRVEVRFLKQPRT